MIFLDNIIFNLQRVGGGSAVWSSLIANLLNLTDDIRFLEYQESERNFFRNAIKIPEDKIIQYSRKARLIDEIKSPSISCDVPFIFHSSYFRVSNSRNAVNVTTVHDFTYEQSRMSLWQKLRVGIDYHAIRRSDAIVCVSHNTCNDLFRFIPGIKRDKVFVIYNGVSEDFHRLPDIPYPEYRDSILYVGGRQGYKNFRFAVEGVAASGKSLVVCGAPLSDDEKYLLESCLKGKYRHVLYPVGEELNKLYNSAYALAYPSSYEGFGIPVIEAQRAGCPVIALDASSIPEVIGKDALMLDSLDIMDFVYKVNEISNAGRRYEVVMAGFENARRFSWAKMASQYFELYNELLAQKTFRS